MSNQVRASSSGAMRGAGSRGGRGGRGGRGAGRGGRVSRGIVRRRIGNGNRAPDSMFPPELRKKWGEYRVKSLETLVKQADLSKQLGRNRSDLDVGQIARASGVGHTRRLWYLFDQLQADMSQPAVVPAKEAHSATVVFLHGLGDTGNGWSPVFQGEVRLDHVKAVCPHAPSRPVTINMGMRMPAWFDILGLDPGCKEDETGIRASRDLVHAMLDAEIAAGIPSDRIVVGGFSMGGALAIYSAITYDKPLAGVLALSAFGVMKNEMPGDHTANKQVHIFQGHGDCDPLVALPFAQMTQKFLSEFNPNIEYKTYPGMGHAACPKELQDVKRWLQQRLPKK